MAPRRSKPELPDDLKALVTDVGRPITSDDIDTYGRLRKIEDRSHRVRIIISAWKTQQTQERNLRSKFANWLLIAVAVQSVLINIYFVLLGLDALRVEEWTSRVFILAVFTEMATLITLVVKYLFARDDGSLLKCLLDLGEE